MTTPQRVATSRYGRRTESLVSVRAPWYSCSHAPGAPRREPAADRTGRAAARARPERHHGRDRGGQDDARARPRPAARRQGALAGSCGPGAAEAYVEGVFALPPGLLRRPRAGRPARAIARRRGRDRARPARRRRGAHARVRPGAVGERGGPARARRTARRVLRPARAPAPDAGLGAARGARRVLRAQAPGRARAVRRGPRRGPGPRWRSSNGCAARAGARERDRDLLAFELDEIDALDPSEEDKASLLAERSRLQRHRRRCAPPPAAGRRRSLPRAANPGVGVAARGGRAAGRRGRGRRSGARRAGRARCARCGSRPTTSAASCAPTRAGSRPSRAGSRRSRRGSTLYDRLERKHGGTVGRGARPRRALPVASSRCSTTRRRRSRSAVAALEVAEAEERAQAADAHEGAPRRRAEARPSACSPSSSSSRWRAPRSRSSCTSARASGRAGAERVEFLIAPNPGVPPAPLRETASGGELSRSMLALMTVADAGGARTLVFDEVDAGHRRPDRARGRRAAARAGRAAARSSASRTCRRSPRSPSALPDRQGRRARRGAHLGRRRSTTTQVVEELVPHARRRTPSDAGARAAREELLRGGVSAVFREGAGMRTRHAQAAGRSVPCSATV